MLLQRAQQALSCMLGRASGADALAQEHSLCEGSMQHGHRMQHVSHSLCKGSKHARVQRLLGAQQALENMQQRQDYMARLLASAYHML